MLSNIPLTEEQKKVIEAHTLQEYPKEMCGILTKDSFIPCENVSQTPEKSFSFSKLEYATYIREAVAVVHSHCTTPATPRRFDLRTPSYADIYNQKRSGIPWLIVGTEGITVTDPLQIPRVPNNNYIGRHFLWYINDCYSLVQDWYRFEKNIFLPDHKATEDFENIRCLSDIFEPYISEYGFREISLDNITEGDLLLLNHAGFLGNHLGIYTKGRILHQDMLSCEVPFETYLGRILKVLTYVG